MALHRDIYWVGRQWSVTGYGMQAIDQKLQGKFDIEVSRLWDDGLLESMQAQNGSTSATSTRHSLWREGTIRSRVVTPRPPRSRLPRGPIP
jgi:hypothetical protein